MKLARCLLVAVFVFATACTDTNADLVLSSDFGVIAGRATIEVHTGQVNGSFAFTFKFGGSLTGKIVGVVCQEKVTPETKPALDRALAKFVSALNDRSQSVLSLQDLVQQGGLTFQTFIASDRVK
jgi:hypothetical protein